MLDKRLAEYRIQGLRAMADSEHSVQIVPTLCDTNFTGGARFDPLFTSCSGYTFRTSENTDSFNNIPTTVDDQVENTCKMSNCEEDKYDVSDFMTSCADDAAHSYASQPNTLHVSSGANTTPGTIITCSDNASAVQKHKLRTGSENVSPFTDTMLEEACFKAAQDEAAQGNLQPLIKQELKFTIQSKRLKEGKNELKVEFTEPAPDVLTPEEQERVEKRKIQNREAARRFRDKQKSKGTMLQKECHRLESVATELRYELSKVARERDELRTKLEEHMKRCPLQNHPTGFYS